MVTKLVSGVLLSCEGLNLAKIHMVTKRLTLKTITVYCLNLAKIHMVTKLMKQQLAPTFLS